MKRKIGLTALAIACAAIASTPALGADEKLAVFTLNQIDEHFEAARVGANKMAAAMGAKVTHYVPIEPYDLTESMSQLEDQLVAKPDAIVFMPLNPQSQLPVIRSIIEAGTPVINFNDKAGEAPFSAYAGQDDVDLGYRVAVRLFEELKGEGNVVILEGIRGNSTSENRQIGFKKALAGFPGIKLLASQPANYSRLEAIQVMENLMQQHARIDGVIATSDNMAVAANEALTAAGRKNVAIVGIDGTTEAAQALLDGRLLAVTEFSGFNMACVATEIAVHVLRGEAYPKEIILPGALITADTAKAWLIPAAERKCPSLSDYAVEGYVAIPTRQ